MIFSPTGKKPIVLKYVWGKLKISVLLSRLSMPPAGRNAQQLKIVDFLSLYGGSSLPRAGGNPQEQFVFIEVFCFLLKDHSLP